MSNPIAKVSLYRLDGELRGTVLRTYEGAGLLPLGDHDVYAAPVTAANQPVPVARINTVGGYPDDSRHELELLVKHCHLFDGQLLYTAQPVPRDVLMAAMREVQEQSAVFAKQHVVSEPFIRHCINLGEIADRYASQVQPERNTVTLEEIVEQLKSGENGDAISEAMTHATADMALGRAIREGRATQPEPVNQQLLAALKMVLDDPDALDGRPRTYKCVMEAIAAAEAAQPVVLEPVGQQAEHNLTDVRCECCGYLTHQREHMGCIRAANPPAVAVPDDYISQAREAAIDVFSGSCSATKDAIEYFAAELRAKLSAAQKPEGHQ